MKAKSMISETLDIVGFLAAVVGLILIVLISVIKLKATTKKAQPWTELSTDQAQSFPITRRPESVYQDSISIVETKTTKSTTVKHTVMNYAQQNREARKRRHARKRSKK